MEDHIETFIDRYASSLRPLRVSLAVPVHWQRRDLCNFISCLRTSSTQAKDRLFTDPDLGTASGFFLGRFFLYSTCRLTLAT